MGLIVKLLSEKPIRLNLNKIENDRRNSLTTNYEQRIAKSEFLPAFSPSPDKAAFDAALRWYRRPDAGLRIQ